MTIETFETLTDEKAYKRIENPLKENIVKVSSRKNKLLAVLDRFEFNILCGLAKRIGIPDEEIQSEIRKGKGVE